MKHIPGGLGRRGRRARQLTEHGRLQRPHTVQCRVWQLSQQSPLPAPQQRRGEGTRCAWQYCSVRRRLAQQLGRAVAQLSCGGETAAAAGATREEQSVTFKRLGKKMKEMKDKERENRRQE